MNRLAVFSIVVLAACSPVSRDAEAPKTVVRDQLQFEGSAEADLFDRASTCFASREGWTGRPLQVHGNFIEGDWCTWRGSCSPTRNREEAGARWASVGTLHYPAEGSERIETFGVQISAGERRAQGWSLSMSASTNGKRILGEHAFITFERHDDAASKFSVGLSYTWRVAERDFFHTVNEDPWQWLARVRTSPEALRDEALAAWSGLRDEVVLALDSGLVRKCVYGEYAGDGIPPDCVEKVPLSSAEVESEKARVEAQLELVKGAMADATGLHASLVDLVPADCF